MLLTRVLTALVGIPIILGAAYAGGLWWDTLVLILLLVSIYEIMQMAGIRDYLAKGVFYISGLALAGVVSGALGFDWQIVLSVIVFAYAVMAVMRFPESLAGGYLLGAVTCLYVSFFMGFAAAINHSHGGAFFSLVCVMLLTWASDTGAFFAGSYLGRHHLAPALSPNKTWEGAVGGAILTVIVAAVLLYGRLGVDSLLLGLGASLLAQIGELFESGLKRSFGAKDSGYILPGHGGVLDRFDSMLLVLPLVFFLLA